MSDLSDKETTILSATTARRTFTPSKTHLKCSVCESSFESLNDLRIHKENDASCRYDINIGSKGKSLRIDQDDEELSFDEESNVNFELSDDQDSFEIISESKSRKNGNSSMTKTLTQASNSTDSEMPLVRKRRKYNKHKASEATLTCESNKIIQL